MTSRRRSAPGPSASSSSAGSPPAGGAGGANASKRSPRPSGGSTGSRVGATPIGLARPTRTGSGNGAESTSTARHPHVPVALGWGAITALVTMMILAAPVFVGWALDPKSSSSWNETLGVAIDLWALAHRAHVHSHGTTVVFSPLLLTFLCVLGARWGARTALPKQRLSTRDIRVILAGYVVGYVLAAQVLGVVSSLGSGTINPLTLVLGPALVAALGVVWATWRARRSSPELSALDDAVVEATPLLAQRSIRSGMRGLRLLALVMLLVGLGLVAWHGQRVWSVHTELHPGAVGAVLLILAQLMALPNLLALLAGWSVGAPVHVGDVIVAHSGVASGTLPMIPVLGAIPQGGVRPWTWICVAAPLLVGAYIGWDAAGSLTRLSSLRAKLVVGLCASALGTVALWIVWWFSTASVSTGLLGYVGPGWTAWLYLPAEFILPALVAAGVRHWVINHRHP